MKNPNPAMVNSLGKNNFPRVSTIMPEIVIRFSERDTMPDQLGKRAKELDITTEQLCKRYLATGMREDIPTEGTTVPGKSLDDFLVKNDVLKPRN